MTGLVIRFCVVFVLGLGIVACATTAPPTPSPTPIAATLSDCPFWLETFDEQRKIALASGLSEAEATAYALSFTNTLVKYDPTLCSGFQTGITPIAAAPSPAPDTQGEVSPTLTPRPFIWAADRTPTPSPTEPIPTPTPTPIDYDEDDNGLIEVRTLAQLNAMRWDMLALGQEIIDKEWRPIASVDYWAAFPSARDGMGCPTANGCSGYELAADLDFDTNGNGHIDEQDAFWNDGAGWESFPSTRHFARQYALSRIDRSAPFEGNGHTIANLYGGSLFWDNYDTISNVVLSGVYVVDGVQGCAALVCENKQGAIISGSKASGYVTGAAPSPNGSAGALVVGGLVGTNSGTITDSTASVAVAGHMVGGLVGRNNGTITNSAASGSVEGYAAHAGGLVGVNSGTISDSAASGPVNGMTSWCSGNSVSKGGCNIGGLVGFSGGTIIASTATGNVSVSPECSRDNDCNVGGLVGINDGGPITGSTASGDVSGHENIGGLVGLQLLGTISDSKASGVVSGTHDIGGLVGDNRSTIKDSEASGAVSGENQIGGLVGLNNGHIERSTASGDVKGVESIGGLVGWHLGNTIERSEARGYVDGYSYVGGLVGATAGFIRDSEANGDVKGVEYVGGLAGGVGGDRESVGFEIGGALSDTRASGYVSGAYYVGGLAGWNSGTIKDSTAKGYVSGKYQVGTLVGANEGGQISNSTGTGKVSEPR